MSVTHMPEIVRSKAHHPLAYSDAKHTLLTGAAGDKLMHRARCLHDATVCTRQDAAVALTLTVEDIQAALVGGQTVKVRVPCSCHTVQSFRACCHTMPPKHEHNISSTTCAYRHK